MRPHEGYFFFLEKDMIHEIHRSYGDYSGIMYLLWQVIASGFVVNIGT